MIFLVFPEAQVSRLLAGPGGSQLGPRVSGPTPEDVPGASLESAFSRLPGAVARQGG